MAEHLKKLIREVPDYPKPGINFFDITTLLKDPVGLEETIQALGDLYADESIDQVVGIESRGFVFAPSLATRHEAGFVPVRKPGKLPARTVSAEYELEYGTDRVEMHEDAVQRGSRVLIVDDLIATGGTAEATAQLIERQGGEIVGFAFAIELSFLPGRERLKPHSVRSLLTY